MEFTLIDLVGSPTTGVRASITGSAGGTISSFFTPVGRPYPSDPWIVGPTRVGDGDLDIPTDMPGLYFVYLTEGMTVVPPVIGRASESEDAVATQCRGVIVDVLKLLNLEEIEDRVFAQMVVDETELKYPCVTVTVGDLNEGEESGLNQLDYIVYPVRVMLFDKHTWTDHRPLPKVERWREAISRAFRNQHLPGVTSSVRVKVEPLIIASQQMAFEKYQHYAGGFVIRCTVREPRGIGA